MITLFTGSPGAGKTASLVDYLSKLPGDRPIYSHGLDGLKIPHAPVDANNWHTELPDGAILVVDEAQTVFRPRSSGAKVPDHVAALEIHRHRGIDIFLTTQAPALIDVNVRNLVGRHVHIRNTGVLGRWWYEWPEVSTNMNWRGCINKKKIKLSKKAFDLYTSASLHTKPEHGIPRSLFVVIFALLVLSGLVYFLYGRLTPKPTAQPEKTPTAATHTLTAGSPPATMSAPVVAYDYAAFVPRVSNKPESAPAYDHLRVVQVMPVITGGYCVGDKCKCVTQQGTDSGLSSRECLDWMENRPFNPYAAPAGRETPLAGTVPTSTHQPPVVAPGTVIPAAAVAS